MNNYGELGYLLAQRRAGMGNQGAASLGSLLGGGGRAQQQMIFNRSALEGARMQDVLAQARQRQKAGIEQDNQIAARHSLSSRYRANGNPELADLFDADNNPEQVAMAHLNLLKGNALSQALGLASAPSIDYNRLNAIKMATANGPTQLVRNLGDGSYTGNAYVTNPDVQVSDIGKAVIGEKNAQSGAANAAAAQHYAGANLDKARTDVVTGKGAAGAKPQALTTELTKAFFSKPVTDANGEQTTDSQGRPVTQIDTNKLQNFMQFDNRPGVSANQNAALPQYMNTFGAQNDNPPPGATDIGDALSGKQAPPTQSAALASPKSQEDFDALPSGAMYVNPSDGKTYRKK